MEMGSKETHEIVFQVWWEWESKEIEYILLAKERVKSCLCCSKRDWKNIYYNWGLFNLQTVRQKDWMNERWKYIIHPENKVLVLRKKLISIIGKKLPNHMLLLHVFKSKLDVYLKWTLLQPYVVVLR